MSGYGTRRSSAQQVRNSPKELSTQDRALTGVVVTASHAQMSAPISISVAESPNAAVNLSSYGAAGSPYSANAFSYGATSLSSSAGKLKRPSGINKTRRLSTSNQLRPASSLLSQSMPSGPLQPAGVRGRSSSISNNHAHSHVHEHEFEEDDAQDATLADAAAQPHSSKLLGSRRDRERIQTFECEICAKKYRHSTCLIKHRWEHTSHWKEASKLLLSKHQQVQLLEGAAILVAASAGTSLPDEKSFWPAAVSPPASGLLGSLECGINVNSLASVAASFGSPRWGPSSLMSDAGDFDRSEVDEAESDIDDDTDSPPPGAGNGSHDEDAQMVEDGIFDLDLGGSTEMPTVPIGPSPRPSPLSRLHPADFSSSPSSASGSATRPALRSADSGFGSLGRANNLKERPSSAATLAAAAGVAASGNALGIVGATFSPEEPQSIRGFNISAAR
ncbi:hypothetical protein JCM10908_000734 [Rhodotorula pacifica]|uniref:uncharacterized protein n=1 Tax=Rhodotorula pacifica TaxID=1495444 RepID=UPI00316FB095